jgi:hypothetical protein
MLRTETLPADLLPEDAVVNDVPISLSITDTDPTGLWTSLGMPGACGIRRHGYRTDVGERTRSLRAIRQLAQHDAADGS